MAYLVNLAAVLASDVVRKRHVHPRPMLTTENEARREGGTSGETKHGEKDDGDLEGLNLDEEEVKTRLEERARWRSRCRMNVDGDGADDDVESGSPRHVMPLGQVKPGSTG